MTSSDIQTSLEDAPKQENILSNEPHIENQNKLGLPTTSAGITADISINILIKSEDINEESLDSLDELEQMILKQKAVLENNESFITVDGCKQEIATSTDPETLFSRDQRTHNAIVARSNVEPPPPYHEFDDRYTYQGQLGGTPIYQEIYMAGTAPPPRDASRSSPYRRNYVDLPYEVDGFDNKIIRHRFIRRVYIILSIQLLLTFGFIATSIYVPKIRLFFQKNWIPTIVALILFMVLMLVLYCYQQTRRIFPLNFFLLFLLTLTMTYITAATSCFYSTDIVMITVGATAGVCLLVTFIACQHWCDITSWGMILGIAGLIIMVYGIIAIVITILTGSNIAYLVYSGLATLVFCMYLMYDTQQILGGRRIELSPEEYIFGALTLYIDIMVIFINLLYLFGACRQ